MSARLLRLAALALFVTSLTACGGSRGSQVEPEEARGEIEEARRSVRDAEERDAEALATQHLTAAKNRLERASAAVSAGDNDAGLRLAREADVTARLAETTALSVKAQRSARELRETIQLLREEIQRLQNQ